MMPNYVPPCQSLSYRIMLIHVNTSFELKVQTPNENKIIAKTQLKPNTTTRIESIITDKHVFYIQGNIKKIFKNMKGCLWSPLYNYLFRKRLNLAR